MRAFKAETMVLPIFTLSYECILSLKGSKKIYSYDNKIR